MLNLFAIVLSVSVERFFRSSVDLRHGSLAIETDLTNGGQEIQTDRNGRAAVSSLYYVLSRRFELFDRDSLASPKRARN